MSLLQAAVSLKETLGHSEERLRGLKRWERCEARQLLLKLHLPLLLLFPLASLAAPLPHILDSFSVGHLFYPPLAVSTALIYAAIFDRISSYFRDPRIDPHSQQQIHCQNTALYLHLPLSGCAFFFLIHPIVGYIMLLFAWLYSTILSLETTAELQKLSRVRVFAHWLSGALLAILPILILLLLVNIERSASIFKTLR